MEPLSIGSAVLGIISASIRIGKPLYDLTNSVIEAPKSAVAFATELNDITSALQQLQAYLIGAERTDLTRKSMLSLKSIVTTLTGCVTTYSEVEEIVKKCTTEGEITGVIERGKWVFHAHEIDGVVGRLQQQKLSLMFMLSILQSESNLEAKQSMQRLEQKVDLLLENTDLRTRIGILDVDHSASFSTAALNTHRARTTFIPKAFENELNKSRVYKRAEGRPMSLYSLNSTERESLALSSFSDLSLGNVSIISVLCLPVWSSDLQNGYHYRFGQVGLELTISELEEQYPDVNFNMSSDPQHAESPTSPTIVSSMLGREMQTITPPLMPPPRSPFRVSQRDQTSKGTPNSDMKTDSLDSDIKRLWDFNFHWDSQASRASTIKEGNFDFGSTVSEQWWEDSEERLKRADRIRKRVKTPPPVPQDPPATKMNEDICDSESTVSEQVSHIVELVKAGERTREGGKEPRNDAKWNPPTPSKPLDSEETIEQRVDRIKERVKELTSSQPHQAKRARSLDQFKFHSALPITDEKWEDNEVGNDPKVLFLAASLFEFSVPAGHSGKEGGIPYLSYVPGEIFDVIGMKGELWLARDQDDPTKTVGWIWEKHFARLKNEP